MRMAMQTVRPKSGEFLRMDWIQDPSHVLVLSGINTSYAHLIPCISRFTSGEINNSSTPAPSSSQNPKVKPESAEAAVMPPVPAMRLANRPDKLPPTASDRNQPPIAKPTSRDGASLVTIDSPIGDRHNSPSVCIT